MRSKFKATPNTVLILCILAMALIVNIVMIAVNNQNTNMHDVAADKQNILFLNIIEFLKAALILFMGFSVFVMVKNVLANAKWQSKYYFKLKQIGWLSVLVLLLDAITVAAREPQTYKNATATSLWANFSFYKDVISETIFSSPLYWFLILCVFLLADILKYSNEQNAANSAAN